MYTVQCVSCNFVHTLQRPKSLRDKLHEPLQRVELSEVNDLSSLELFTGCYNPLCLHDSYISVKPTSLQQLKVL